MQIKIITQPDFVKTDLKSLFLMHMWVRHYLLIVNSKDRSTIALKSPVRLMFRKFFKRFVY